VHLTNLAEFEEKVGHVQDFLKSNPERGPVLRALDDLHGFLGSEIQGWTRNEEIVSAYQALRSERDRLHGGEDVMDRIRSAVDRLLDSIRSAREAEA
jgi:hypothetical protein